MFHNFIFVSKTEFKKLWKPFVFLFLIIFFVINWNNVSYIFNYKVVWGYFSNIVQEDSNPAQANIFNGNNKEIIGEYSNKENALEISKINISAPLILGENLYGDDLHKLLDKGVVYFPDSVLPGENGQTIILGHSAPSNWPKIKYDCVFSHINDLIEGDEIFIYFNHQKYTYCVNGKFFLDKGEEVPRDLTVEKNTLILISCWPPGKNYKRIAVEAFITDN